MIATVIDDYDGTIARQGRVEDETVAALGRLRETGRRLILVTGRELQDLLTVCPHFALFDRIVAENGAVVYRPATGEERLLGERPPEAFVRALRARGVSPVSVGRVIVATWKPHEITVLEAIRNLGLELHVTFNKDAARLPLGRTPESTLQLAHFIEGLASVGVIGTGRAGHALARACSADIAPAGTLGSARVLRRGPRDYYGPLGFPLRRARFRRRRIRAALPRRRLHKRASRVPFLSVHACCAPYPAETCCMYASGLRRSRRGLRRDMIGSVLGL